VSKLGIKQKIKTLFHAEFKCPKCGTVLEGDVVKETLQPAVKAVTKTTFLLREKPVAVEAPILPPIPAE
jgi:transcription initiation factor IIE alpha subunit